VNISQARITFDHCLQEGCSICLRIRTFSIYEFIGLSGRVAAMRWRPGQTISGGSTIFGEHAQEPRPSGRFPSVDTKPPRGLLAPLPDPLVLEPASLLLRAVIDDSSP
jgi:hypothetical protein